MKLRNIIIIILIAALLVAGALSSFIGIPVKAGEYNPLKSLTLGSDLGGGNYLFINVAEDSDITGHTEEVLKILRNRLKVFGINDSSVDITDDGGFIVKLPLNSTFTEQEVAQLAQTLITVGDITIADAYNDDTVFLYREHLKEVDIRETSLGKYTVYFLLTNEGKEILKTESERISQTETASEKYVHIFYDGEQISEITLREVVDNGIIGFNTSFTQAQAEYFKDLLNSGKLPVNLELDTTVKTGGISANGIGDYITVLIVISALYCLYMLIENRLAGLFSVLSYLGMIGCYITVAAATGLKATNLSIAGAFAGSIFYMVATIILLEKTKKEYILRKHMQISFRNGYREFVSTITNIGFLLLLVFVVYIAADNAALEIAGFGFGVALVLAYIFAVVINWILLRCLVGITDNGKLFFSYREEKGGQDK